MRLAQLTQGGVTAKLLLDDFAQGVVHLATNYTTQRQQYKL